MKPHVVRILAKFSTSELLIISGHTDADLNFNYIINGLSKLIGFVVCTYCLFSEVIVPNII